MDFPTASLDPTAPGGVHLVVNFAGEDGAVTATNGDGMADPQAINDLSAFAPGSLQPMVSTDGVWRLITDDPGACFALTPMDVSRGGRVIANFAVPVATDQFDSEGQIYSVGLGFGGAYGGALVHCTGVVSVGRSANVWHSRLAIYSTAQAEPLAEVTFTHPGNTAPRIRPAVFECNGAGGYRLIYGGKTVLSVDNVPDLPHQWPGGGVVLSATTGDNTKELYLPVRWIAATDLGVELRSIGGTGAPGAPGAPGEPGADSSIRQSSILVDDHTVSAGAVPVLLIDCNSNEQDVTLTFPIGLDPDRDEIAGYTFDVVRIDSNATYSGDIVGEFVSAAGGGGAGTTESLIGLGPGEGVRIYAPYIGGPYVAWRQNLVSWAG